MPFLWLADLAKHSVDFFYHTPRVSLQDFERYFFRWTRKLHWTDPNYQHWLKQYGREDFRHAVIAHAEFLYKEATLLDLRYGYHPIW